MSDVKEISFSFKIFFYRQPANSIRWQDSPTIDSTDQITDYKIYRKEQVAGTEFQLLAFIPRFFNLPEYKYFDIRIVPFSKYTSASLAMRKDGRQGPCSEGVNDSY